MPIFPNQGSISGGILVTITGVNLANAKSVHFGNKLAVITTNTPTSIIVRNPPGSGVVTVTVTTNGGTSNSLFFYYIPYPIITSINVDSGPLAGGNTIILYGNNLLTTHRIQIGLIDSTPFGATNSEILFIMPPGPSMGHFPITIDTAGGSAGGVSYSYIGPPDIELVSPNSGSSLAGTSVMISGQNFSTTISVSFGGIDASFDVINSSMITAITPPNDTGVYDLVVTTAGGVATVSNAYTYVDSATI